MPRTTRNSTSFDESPKRGHKTYEDIIRKNEADKLKDLNYDYAKLPSKSAMTTFEKITEKHYSFYPGGFPSGWVLQMKNPIGDFYEKKCKSLRHTCDLIKAHIRTFGANKERYYLDTLIGYAKRYYGVTQENIDVMLGIGRDDSIQLKQTFRW